MFEGNSRFLMINQFGENTQFPMFDQFGMLVNYGFPSLEIHTHFTNPPSFPQMKKANTQGSKQTWVPKPSP